MVIMAKRDIEIPKPKPPLHTSDTPPVSPIRGSQQSHCTETLPAAANQFSGNQMFHATELKQKDKTIFEDFHSPYPAPPSDRQRSGTGAGESEIKAIREKLVMDIQVETDQIRVAILGQGIEKAPVEESSTGEVERRWNLRGRRERAKVDVGRKSESSLAMAEALTRRKRERPPERSVSLSRREIEEDFMAIVGHRLPRRPKKRPPAIQKELDHIFPGSGLSKITPDLFKVYDGFETLKR